MAGDSVGWEWEHCISVFSGFLVTSNFEVSRLSLSVFRLIDENNNTSLLNYTPSTNLRTTLPNPKNQNHHHQTSSDPFLPRTRIAHNRWINVWSQTQRQNLTRCRNQRSGHET